ncbi:lipase member H isoform X2 [Electrophorus electricus]|uniref:Lipase domain-containing protein n=1 Tax=Electrophorus electricus TaxID=8005 RepID=A0A4W4EC68_ELEEL|nr:lipase member H isoform X2 [Electrophorus electricus]XP_026851687.2 lipase member H isoform X2 [Electrophorus electricus]XP_026851689.2 lipase member H isoform X2 [Electrophorus electricus]XP_026851691.2 lipase member H isoform X2 [Electrophorus electricus]XP_026851692.2 lipase member H isoform X2 [Electrophorus electricus]XP_035383420.1 lipase member H isoform X2 [Electrophorus electricus]XP_035383421.1 lipase member H isoform X2 [Electrophorus electricus]XP_035383422.1 lipase member H i
MCWWTDKHRQLATMPWCLFLAVVLASLAQYPAEKCEEITDLDLKHSIAGSSVQVRLLLYTRANVSCGVLLSHDDPFSNPEFNVSRPTTFIIHGYRPTGSPPIWMHKVVEATLSHKDVNAVVVDWNRGATHIIYPKVVENTRLVASNLTAFLLKMQLKGISLSSVHMIGVSLGAHISGFTGASFNGSIGRITALDPAGPSFTGKPVDDRLDPSDAQFVEALHTDMDAFGFRNPLGHIDFYANGGADQPGCPKTIFSGSQYFKCDHQRSVFLYVASFNVTCPLIGYPCASYSDYLDGKCLRCDQFSSAGCPVFGPTLINWKDLLVKLGQTSTYFTTNKQSPFCQTNYEVDILTWNSQPRWGSVTIKLQNPAEEAMAQINHKSFKFEMYTKTTLLARFDRALQLVETITLTYSTGNVCAARHKLRVLRLRLTPLDSHLRPMCRYDVLLMENTEVTFRPIPCQDSNF